MIAIIPARGGSKGLPEKNIKIIDGNPLISYTIKAALEAECVSNVIVSTDSLEIASISKSYGADIPFMRPNSLAQDESNALDVYLYTVDKLEKKFNQEISSFMVLLPTSPLRLPRDIEAASTIFHENDADSVISVTEAECPIEWYKNITESGLLVEIELPGAKKMVNRQEHKILYIPNGSIYVFKTQRLREERTYYMKKTFPYIMPRERSVDIDDIVDFKLAECLMAQVMNS